MKVFVGSVRSVSPAFGSYKIDLYQSIDTTENKLVSYGNVNVVTGIMITGSMT